LFLKININFHGKIVRLSFFIYPFSLKPGRIVIMLAGKYAGKKAVLLRANEEPTKVKILFISIPLKEKKFGHGIVVGLDRYPRSVHKRMN